MPRTVVTGSELPLVAARFDGLPGAADPVARPAVAPRAVERIADAPHDEPDRSEDAVEEDGQDDAAVHLAEERPGTHPHALDRREYTRRHDRGRREEDAEAPKDERRHVVAAQAAHDAEREEDAADREPEAPELDCGEWLHVSRGLRRGCRRTGRLPSSACRRSAPRRA